MYAWVAHEQLLRRADPIELRHHHVHQDHVRLQFTNQTDRLCSVRCFADYNDVVGA
jgi:hypothetical protein